MSPTDIMGSQPALSWGFTLSPNTYGKCKIVSSFADVNNGEEIEVSVDLLK